MPFDAVVLATLLRAILSLSKDGPSTIEGLQAFRGFNLSIPDNYASVKSKLLSFLYPNLSGFQEA